MGETTLPKNCPSRRWPTHVLLSHPILSYICSYHHQTTKNDQSSHNHRKHSKLIKNFGPSSPSRGENNYKYSKICSTKLSPHQTEQSESFQETTSFTVVTSSEQDFKNSQLIIIPYGFYVETSWHHSNNLRSLINAAAVVYEAVSEAVSDAVSEADTSHFHELSRKIN